MTNQIDLEKSEGHTAFIGKFEYYTLPNGDLHRAPTLYPVMPDGRRSGRWECKANQIDMQINLVREFI